MQTRTSAAVPVPQSAWYASCSAFAPATEPKTAGEQADTEEGWHRIGSAAYVWDLNAADPGKPLVLRGHGGEIKDAALTPDNRSLVTGSADKTARLWDLAAVDPSASPLVFSGHVGAVEDVAVTVDRRWLVTASHDGAARLWDLKAADPTARAIELRNIERRIDDSYQYTNHVHVSPDGHWLVTAGSSHFGAPARLWDLTAADPSARSTDLGKISPEECAFSPDGRWLIIHRVHDDAGHRFNEARLWDLTKGPSAPFILASGPGKFVASTAFSPDGRWLYTSSYEREVRRWDLAARDPSSAPLVLSSPLKDPKEYLGDITLSPDGRWLAADGSEPGQYALWDLSVKDPAATARVLDNPQGMGLSGAAFTPDSRWLVTSHDSMSEQGNTLWKLDVADTAPVSLPGGKLISGGAFSADGRWLVARGVDSLQLWPMRLDELLDLACRAAGRNLTQGEWKEYFPGQEYRRTCAGLPAGQ